MVESLPASAGDRSSSPGPGGSHAPQSSRAHAPQLLSLCSGACKPQLLSPCATTAEAPRLEPMLRVGGERGHRGEEWPPLAAIGESP